MENFLHPLVKFREKNVVLGQDQSQVPKDEWKWQENPSLEENPRTNKAVFLKE
jgi:hypothetical protein